MSERAALHPVFRSDQQLLAECAVHRLRRSGPGGQRRNKVETAVRLVHRPSGLEAEANERRSQSENQRAALRRLRLRLAREVRCAPGPADPPSDTWQARLRGDRLVVSPAHADYPALLAEALDHLASRGWDLRAAAERLGCTASQLARLLRHDRAAWGLVNARRVEAGLHRLR